MNVLSIFDGMSCGQIALERAGIPITNYFASEIDKYAIKVTQANYPETQQLGCVTDWPEWDLPKIDLLIAGFPCQAWSLAGKQKGDNDPRGALVHDLIAIWKKYNPKYFLFENVKMKKEFIEYINKLFGVEPVLINSSLVSAQNRERNYWTNIPDIEQPEDKGILLKDIIENCDFNPALNMRPRGNNKGGLRAIDGKTPSLSSSSWEDNFHLVDRDKSHCLDANYYKGGNLKSYFEKHRRQLVFSKDGLCHHFPETLKYRKLTPLECERLQTLDDNYTNHVSNTQRYKMIGNGWTVDVIEHIFKSLPVYCGIENQFIVDE